MRWCQFSLLKWRWLDYTTLSPPTNSVYILLIYFPNTLRETAHQQCFVQISFLIMLHKNVSFSLLLLISQIIEINVERWDLYLVINNRKFRCSLQEQADHTHTVIQTVVVLETAQYREVTAPLILFLLCILKSDKTTLLYSMWRETELQWVMCRLCGVSAALRQYAGVFFLFSLGECSMLPEEWNLLQTGWWVDHFDTCWL